MENTLIKRLAALAKVISQKRDIESAALERLNTKMNAAALRLTMLERQNRIEPGQLPPSGSAMSQWAKQYQALRSENLTVLWQAKANVEAQKLVLRRVIAQHQAVQLELERSIKAEKLRQGRRADYAS